MTAERIVILLESLKAEMARQTRDAIIDAITDALSETSPTRITIYIQGGAWTSVPAPAILTAGTDVEFINMVAGKDLMLHFTAGACRLSDPEFVIPDKGSRIISVTPGCSETAVAHLWMRDAEQTAADWEKVDSGTGNGAGMQIDNP